MAKTETLSIKPLGDRVVVRPYSKSEEIASSIGMIIPDTVKKEKSEIGTIVAAGPGRYEDGKLIPMSVKVGDRILFQHVYDEPVKLNDQDYYIFSEGNILAIIPKN